MFNFVGRKNARVLLKGVNFHKTMFLSQYKFMSNKIQPPKDRLNVEPIRLDIGDYAESERIFTTKDIELFATAAQDKHAHHLHPDNAKTFYKSNIVYGIFTSSMFTMVVRELFPGAIYLGQSLKFTAPVHVDEPVKAKLVVSDIRADKRIVTFQTVVTKLSDNNKVAIEGDGKFIIPNLQVRILIDFTPSFRSQKEM